MFEILPGSQPLRGGHFGGTAFSFVTHGTLIAVALASTQGTSPYAHGDQHAVPAEHVTYVAPSQTLREAAATESKNARAAVKKVVHKIWTLSAALLEVGDGVDIKVPDLHLDDALNQQTDDWLSRADALSADTAKTLAQSVGVLVVQPLAGGIYTPEMVDRIVAPRPGNPTPRYPSALLSAGVEQTFDVTFVVDTTGKVEEPTIAFPTTAHHLFIDAVKNALLRSSYFPAYLGGRLVPQLVEQQFRFVVR